MDRARQPGAPRPGRLRTHPGRHRGGALRGSRGGAGVLLLALATAIACGQLGPGLDRIVAISIATPPDSLEELDTLRLHGFAVDGHGDSVAATVLWATLDTALLTVVNDTTGVMVGKQASATPARIEARVENLFSNPTPIRVLAAADTVFAAAPTRDSVSLAAKPDSLSDSLTVRLQDTTATGPVDLSGRPVAFALTVYPGPGANVALVTSDTARAPVAADTMTTTVGLAGVKLRLLAGPAPDSAVVTASARRAVGTPVAGSPVTFVVRFLP